MASVQRRLLTVAVIIAVVSCAAACGRVGGGSEVVAAADKVAWERDLAAALTRAGNENKLVMVDFYTDWCGWCRKLDETTYSDAAVQTALGNLVAVKLDAEREGRQAAQAYGVGGYPTVVFLNSEGREVGRIPGYLPPGPFLDELNDIVKRG